MMSAFEGYNGRRLDAGWRPLNGRGIRPPRGSIWHRSSVRNWQTSDYGYWDDSEGTPVRRPLAEMKLKSQIARPRVYETLELNRSYTILAPHGRGTPMLPRSGSASMAGDRGFRAIFSTRSTGTHGDAGSTTELRRPNPPVIRCWRVRWEQTDVPSQTVTIQISAAM
jgi:hypothetical protein